jgi:predicted RNA-binding protein YlxR (DUF448 family)
MVMSTARPSRRKHIPIRTCVVCGEKSDKRSLIRLVRTPEGLQIDPSGKMNGRGAYLCEQERCWESALQSSILAKALRMTLTDEDRKRLQQAQPLHRDG